MGENEFVCARKAKRTETVYENGLTLLMTNENILFEMYILQGGGLSELVRQGRRLGEKWGVKMTAHELSEVGTVIPDKDKVYIHRQRVKIHRAKLRIRYQASERAPHRNSREGYGI